MFVRVMHMCTNKRNHAAMLPTPCVMAETDKNAIIRTFGLEKVFDGAVPAEFKTVKEVPMMGGVVVGLLFGG